MISEKLVKTIEDNFRASFSRVFPHKLNFEAAARDLVNEKRAIEELERVSRSTTMDLQGKKMLEIGSGFGMLVAVARKRFGAEAFGVEPSEQFRGSYPISLSVLKEMGIEDNPIRIGCGEDIPHEDGLFDIVYSSNVIEHVKDPAKVFAESVRVAKSGGYIIHNIPNYGSWWEGHYGIFMPPYSPAWLLKLIVMCMGRDPSFVDTLQLVTYKKIREWLSPCLDSVEVLDWGQSLWVERMKSLSFSEWAMLGKLKRVLKIVNYCGLTSLIISLGKVFHWETPFLLVISEKV